MIFSKADKQETVVIATCGCGCNSEIQIKKFIDEDKEVNIPDEYYISLHSSKFEEEQAGIFTVIGKRLKRAWYNLIGKDYLYMDILLSEQEFDEFIEKLQKVRK